MDDSVYPTIIMDDRVCITPLSWMNVCAFPPISWMTVCIPPLSWMTECASHHCHGWQCVHPTIIMDGSVHSHHYHGWQCVSHHCHGSQGVHLTIVMDDSEHPTTIMDDSVCIPPLSWITVNIPPLSWMTVCASHHYHGWQGVHLTIIRDDSLCIPTNVMDERVNIPPILRIKECASHLPSPPPPTLEGIQQLWHKRRILSDTAAESRSGVGEGKMHSLGKIGKNFTQFLLFWGLKYVLAVFHLFSVITSPHSFTLYILKNGNSFLTAYY